MGTGIDDGVSCRPSIEQILHTCQNVPPSQPRPTAFSHLVNEAFGTEIQGAQCFEGLCEFRAKLVEWDYVLACGCVLLVIATICLRYILNECIRSHKASIQRMRANELKIQRKRQTGRPLIEDDETP